MIGLIVTFLWLVMDYFLIREVAYEKIDENGQISMKDWLGMIFGLTVGAPVLFFMMLMWAERKNLRRAFFMSPVPKERNPHEFVKARILLGKFFLIKEK
jgi:hypothetical protein